MIKILKAEFFRLKNFKTYFILLGIVAFLPLLSFLMTKGSLILVSSEFVNWDGCAMMFISTTATFGSTTDLIALICTAVFLCREFGDGPIRNAILSNKSRTTIYFSYFIVALFIGVSYCLAEYVMQVLCFSTFGFGELSFNKVFVGCVETFTLSFFLTIFSQCTVVMFLFCTRKMATTIIFPILVAQLAPAYISSFFGLLANIGAIKGNAQRWLPFFNLQLFDASNPNAILVLQVLLYIVPVSALFVYLGWNSFRKADLK